MKPESTYTNLKEMKPELRSAAVDFFVTGARTGEILIYHTGFLSIDRCNVAVLNGALVYDCTSPVSSLADQLIDAFKQGKVHLFQRKIADNVYEYLAVKRSKYVRNW